MKPLRAACVQLCSGTDVAQNIDFASALIAQAAEAGAQFVATPEMTALMDARPGELLAKTVAEADDPALKAFRDLAARRKLWLLIGSLAIRVSPTHCANRSFLIAPDGAVAARYDKIHMFDVTVGDGRTYHESKQFAPGETVVAAPWPWGKLGLTVCYDLRFPALYRKLAQAGAGVLTVPAAFTRVTGQAHWHILLRARAIETGAFIVAPAQGGRHADGRETFGHSLIVGPWGEILGEADGADPGLVLADLDLDAVAEARRKIPAVTLDRPMAIVRSAAPSP